MSAEVSIDLTDDVEALIVPHREAMLKAYRGLFTTPFPDDDTLRGEWRTVLATRDARAYLARLAGRPAGTVSTFVDAGGNGWIQKLYVHPDAQHRGVGRALHDRMLDDLRERGCHEANLWVLAANSSAIRHYRRWGWQRLDSPPYAPHGLPEWRFVLPLG